MKSEFRRGHCVYEAEVKELMQRLDAQGILLVVLKGKRNIDDVEVSAGIPADQVDFVSKSMMVTAIGLQNQLHDFIHKTVKSN